MEMSLIPLALAYVFLVFLLILSLLRSELGTPLKILLVVLAGWFYVWHYNGLQAFRGWPAEQRLPEKFEMISRVVIEPNLKRDEQGGIYLWVRDLDQAQLTPRAYRLPYSRDTHRKVDDTLHKQRHGQRFVGSPASNAASGPRGAIQFEAVQPERRSLKPGSDD